MSKEGTNEGSTRFYLDLYSEYEKRVFVRFTTVYLEMVINRSYLPHLHNLCSYYLPSFLHLLLRLISSACVPAISLLLRDPRCLPSSRFLGLNALMKDVSVSLTSTIMFCALSISHTMLIWPQSTTSMVPGWRRSITGECLSIWKHAMLGIFSHLPSCASLHVSANALL